MNEQLKTLLNKINDSLEIMEEGMELGRFQEVYDNIPEQQALITNYLEGMQHLEENPLDILYGFTPRRLGKPQFGMYSSIIRREELFPHKKVKRDADDNTFNFRFG